MAPKISAVLLSIFIVSACTRGEDPASHLQPCSDEWQQYVEAQLQTGDSQGHGPDIGSTEWRSVVEFKLGIRGDPAIPDRQSDEWCRYIDARVRALR